MGYIRANNIYVSFASSRTYTYSTIFDVWTDPDFPNDWSNVTAPHADHKVEKYSTAGLRFIVTDGALTEIKIARDDAGLSDTVLYYFEIDVSIVTNGGFVYTDGAGTTHSYSTTGKKTGSFTQSGTISQKLKRDGTVNSGNCDLVINSFKVDTSVI